MLYEIGHATAVGVAGDRENPKFIPGGYHRPRTGPGCIVVYGRMEEGVVLDDPYP